MTQETQEQTTQQETSGPLTFELSLETQDVTLVKADGTKMECYLQEMDGFHRDKHLNDQKPKYESNGQAVKDFTDIQADLIAISLFEHGNDKDEKGKPKPVPKAVIREFPSRVQVKLYEIASRMNGLDEKAIKEASKNS